MSDPSGGNQGGFLEGIAAIVTAAVAVGGLLVGLFRKKADDNADIVNELKAGVLEIRKDALEGHDEDYRRQTHRVHQLEDFITAHHLTVPPRDDHV